MIYESLLAVAVLFAAALIYMLIFGTTNHTSQSASFRSMLVLTLACYFIPQWTFGGQTLPMKTWHLRIETERGYPLTIGRATMRYAAAWVSLILFGTGFVWALFDRNGQFLHDRVCGTRIVYQRTTAPGLNDGPPATSSA